MEHYEMVEKLRQKAHVTYEEAKEALERCDWDMLDALVLLENEGKVKQEDGANASYSTQPKAKPQVKAQENSSFADGVRKFWKLLCKLFQMGNANSFVVKNKKGEESTAMPITVLVILMVVCWPLSLIVLVIGLFSNYRYSFSGPDINSKVNDAMNKAADVFQEDEKE